MSTPVDPKHLVREAVSLYAAKTRLSSLVDRAAAGEEIIIMKSGEPLARLVPMEDLHSKRVPGKGKGAWQIDPDFDAPLPESVLRDFEGR